MDSELLREFIEAVLESREEDFEKIEAANGSFDAIVNYIKALGKDVRAFDNVFMKDSNGYFLGFALGARIRRKEHLKLSVFFVDRGIAGSKKTINAQASRFKVQPDNPGSTALKGFRITIYLDAPQEVKGTPKAYNKWLAGNLETILDNPATKSSYTHEFTHVADFKRIDPAYLNQRSQNKAKERERMQAAGEKKRDFGAYANDPLELNAYFSQAMSDVMNDIAKAQSTPEKQAIIGNTPQEFAQKFMQTYLKKQVQKNIDPENEKRLLKRAATSWDLLKQKIG